MRHVTDRDIIEKPQQTLEELATGELELLRDHIEAILARRELEERPQQTPDRRTVGEVRHTSAGSYRWEMVRCGKDRCKKCRDRGEGHGPYLYRYFRRGGKLASEYVKLSELASHPGAPSRPVSAGT